MVTPLPSEALSRRKSENFPNCLACHNGRYATSECLPQPRQLGLAAPLERYASIMLVVIVAQQQPSVRAVCLASLLSFY